MRSNITEYKFCSGSSSYNIEFSIRWELLDPNEEGEEERAKDGKGEMKREEIERLGQAQRERRG